MGVSRFEELRRHVGHKIVCVGYGRDELVNVAIECEDCNEVLLDYDREDVIPVRIEGPWNDAKDDVEMYCGYCDYCLDEGVDEWSYCPSCGE